MPSGLLRPYASRIALIQRMLDVVLILFAYAAVAWLIGAAWDTKRIFAGVFAAVFFMLFAEMQGLYRSWRVSSFWSEVGALLITWLSVIFSLLALAFLTKTSELYSRVGLTVWWLTVPVMLIVVRMLVRFSLRFVRRHGANVRTVAVVGNNPIGDRVIQHLEEMPWAGLVVSGVFCAESDRHRNGSECRTDYPVGDLDDLMQKVHAGEIDLVYLALPSGNASQLEELVAKLADTTASVYVVPDLFISELMHARWTDFGGMPMISVYESPFQGMHSWVKRLEDMILASSILLLISPLMIMIALMIKATSSGPVLFRQRRYGLNGAVVWVWKFRSMTVCEDGPDIPQAKKGDARITPLGAFLRRTSLDELPQFFNVLQGTMSVVGPRPHAVAHNEQYRKLIKGYMLRHKVKPGITGWAQVNGWRGETDTLDKMLKRVEYDLEYIQNWSLWLDLKIVFLTVFRGFGGKNAY
ncbi:MAG: undecaprenyl-phosphate glucose phosphotransferase [Gallionella sp.]|nr:undecaprenyl-phosphate glucose phosphotransferase [Gallionella sp.]